MKECLPVNLKINEKALKWYKDELDLKEGDQVRFFVRYGGCSNVQKGFSLGVSKDEPQQIGVSAEKDGITFFVEESDVWYFDGHDLLVSYNESSEEPTFEYQ
nr:HesB/YadR/YfhF family protein [Bacillus haynesii]